jgi:ABC-2 type transport system ATP-binding protein
MSVISIDNLTKRYGARRGVESINLAVEAGAIFGFLGPNGAGKTTTIRVLLGFLRATAGGARIFGEDCWKRSSAVKREIGYVPGDLRLYPWMTLKSAMRIGGRIRSRDCTGGAMPLAERFSLDPDLIVRKMSRGTRQKLGIILALAHRPKVLIFDEPTSGLDPLMQDELARVIRERAAEGTTVFFSSHTLSEVEHLCDRVAIVRDGRIAADETIQSLRARARRTATLVFSDADRARAAQPPEFMRILERSGRLWRAELRGGAKAFLDWCHGQPLDDATLGPPDLESIFRSFYLRDEGEKSPEAAAEAPPHGPADQRGGAP